MPSNLTDPSFLLKLLEIVICVAGVALLHQVHTYYSVWVMHTLLLGTGGYLLISTVIAVSCQVEDFPYFCETMLLSAGWIMNFVGGCMVMTRCALRSKNATWTEVVTPSAGGGNDYLCEIALGVVVLVLSILFFVDFIVVVMNKRGSDVDDEDVDVYM